MRKNLGKMIAGVGLLVAMAISAPADPRVHLDTATEWQAALTATQIKPVDPATWATWLGSNSGFYNPAEPQTYWSAPPELYVYSGPSYPPVEEEGLVMTWGPTTPGSNYTAAWRYDYGTDPNLLGSTVMVSVAPPQFNLAGNQVNSVGVGLVDGAGLIRSWTWNCALAAAPGTIAWNQMWLLSMGPIGLFPPADPASATPPIGGPPVIAPAVFFNAGGFNPANVMSIIAIESGQNVGQWVAPPGGGQIPLVWNFWGQFQVPEPGTMGLLALAACALLGVRRRN